jgi:hypothetical protein
MLERTHGMRSWQFTLALVPAVLVFSSIAIVRADSTVQRECLEDFTADACDQRRVAWLPNFGESAQWWRQGLATRVKSRDGFACCFEPTDTRPLGYEGPDDGTLFVVEADGGPPRGHVVYDPVHRIVLYDTGCCAYHDVIAAQGIGPPPVSVVERDLSRLKSVRGVALGMPRSKVLQIYGPAQGRPVPRHPELTALAYTTWPPYGTFHRVGLGGTPCGQFEDFIFKKDALVYMQFGNGC